jgi:hypothetical protein
MSNVLVPAIVPDSTQPEPRAKPGACEGSKRTAGGLYGHFAPVISGEVENGRLH